MHAVRFHVSNQTHRHACRSATIHWDCQSVQIGHAHTHKNMPAGRQRDVAFCTLLCGGGRDNDRRAGKSPVRRSRCAKAGGGARGVFIFCPNLHDCVFLLLL